jgi:hypothetical protein
VIRQKGQKQKKEIPRRSAENAGRARNDSPLFCGRMAAAEGAAELDVANRASRHLKASQSQKKEIPRRSAEGAGRARNDSARLMGEYPAAEGAAELQLLTARKNPTFQNNGAEDD